MMLNFKMNNTLKIVLMVIGVFIFLRILTLNSGKVFEGMQSIEDFERTININTSKLKEDASISSYRGNYKNVLMDMEDACNYQMLILLRRHGEKITNDNDKGAISVLDQFDKLGKMKDQIEYLNTFIDSN